MKPEKCSKCAKFYDAEKYQTCPFCNYSSGGTNQNTASANYNYSHSHTQGKSFFKFGKKQKNNEAETVTNLPVDFFDTSKNIPSTAGGKEAVFSTGGESETQLSVPSDNSDNGNFQQGVTVKLGSYDFETYPKTVPLESSEETDVSESSTDLRNEIIRSSSSMQKNTASDKTVAFYDTPENNEPVSGWLVCVKGSYSGDSFKLYIGKNHIGRSLNMTVALAKEKTVSRDKHATITFDPVAKQFYLQAGDGNGLTYLNGKLVLVPETLKIYDTITLGECSLVFIPLCCENFDWDSYLSK